MAEAQTRSSAASKRAFPRATLRRLLLRSKTAVAVAVTSCVLTAPTSLAQVVLPPVPREVSQKAPQATITLGIVVTDGAGQPVSNLRQQDFTVLDEKTPSPILNFAVVPPVGTSQTPQGEPAQAIFVLDEVNMTFIDASRALAQLVSFLRAGDRTLRIPVSVLVLTDTSVEFNGSPSRDAQALATDLEKLSASLRSIRRSSSYYGDAERVDLSLRTLLKLAAFETARPGRKQVIWISPGWPYLANPGIQYSDKQRRSNFSTVADLSTRLRQAGITLYSVDPRGTDDAGGFQTTVYHAYLKGARAPSDTTLANLGLQVLAAQSGGLVLNSSNDVSRELAVCYNDWTTYYVVSIAAAPAEHTMQYHALSVKLDRAAFKARTRAGYYALPALP